MKKFHIISVTLGIALLLVLLHEIGLQALAEGFRTLGWRLIPFVLLEGLVDISHTLGWRYCLTGPHRLIPYQKLFRIRLAGGAINYFTPTATLGGEVTKGTLLASDNGGGTGAITSVVIGKLSYTLSQLLFVAVGSVYFLWGLNLPQGVWPAMLAGNAILVTGTIGFLLLQRYGKLGILIRWLVNRRIGGRSVQRLADELNAVDQELRHFYERRPKDLPLSMIWHAVGFVCSVGKTWYFLAAMTDSGTLFVAAGIWFLSGWFDLLTFPVPLSIGVHEGIKVFAFNTLGLGMAMGLTYGVALRVEQLFWAGLGLLSYASLLPGNTGGEKLNSDGPGPGASVRTPDNPPVPLYCGGQGEHLNRNEP